MVSEYRRWFGKSPSGICGGFWTKQAQLDRTIHNLRDKYDLYTGINPATTWRGIKVSDSDISTITTILIDFDPLTPTLSPRELLLPAIGEFFCPLFGSPVPGTIIDTGRGAQLWLHVFPHPVLNSLDRTIWRTTIRNFLVAMNRAWAGTGGFQIDTSCSDLSRLGRAIGSINHRTGNEVRQLFAPDRFQPVFAPILERVYTSQEYPESAIPALHHNGDWKKAFSHLTVTARRFISEGVAEGERNHAAYAAARSLRDLGLTISDAAKALAVGARLCEPPMPTSELTRCLTNAYAGDTWPLRESSNPTQSDSNES